MSNWYYENYVPFEEMKNLVTIIVFFQKQSPANFKPPKKDHEIRKYLVLIVVIIVSSNSKSKYIPELVSTSIKQKIEFNTNES